jgi:DNA-binding transcriptional LysR family regulator
METINRNLDALTAFHLVAELGSFTLAGEKLGLSKSMVSKQVKRLEVLLSTQLFLRTTRTLALTEEGKALFGYSNRIMNLSSEAEKSLQGLNFGKKGQIYISAPLGLGPVFFSSFLPKIAKELPDVQIHANISNQVQDIVRENIDFAIRAAEVQNPNFVARYLGQVRDVVCVAPKLGKSIVQSDPKNLEHFECILYGNKAKWNTWTLVSGTQEVQVEVTGRYVTNTYQAALAFCLDGLGIARLPFYIAAESISRGDLVQLFPKYKMATHPLYLVYAQSEYKSPKHTFTKRKILEWFKTRPDFFL